MVGKTSLSVLLASTLTLGAGLSVGPNARAADLTGEDIQYVWAVIQGAFAPNYNYTTNASTRIYKTWQPPSIKQAEEALDYLEFSDDVYTAYRAPAGWSRMENISYSSGFYAALFTNGSKMVVAFRGSELGTSDWITNGIMIQEQLPEQYRQAIDLALYVRNRYAAYDVSYTGHSLGGGLSTAAAMTSGDPAVVFDSAGLANIVVDEIKSEHAARGLSGDTWLVNARGITNYNMEGEFVSDSDRQQDADTLGATNQQYGTIYYLSDDRFTPLFLFDTPLTRHFTFAIEEELEFLAQPFYRNNPYDYTGQYNGINGFRSLFYIDYTDDTADIIAWQFSYSINSIPSLLQDLGL